MKCALLGLAAILLLSGCQAKPFARELEDTMLVQVLGVDWENETVTLTAAANPEKGSGGTGTAVLSAQGTDLKNAKAALRAAGEEYISLTHVTQLVLGRNTKTTEVLNAALEDPALGQSATVWLAKTSTAEKLLNAVDGGAKRLSSIELNSGVKPVTVLQALMWLEERGEVALPALGLEEDKLILVDTETVRGAND